jgi:hypothetical protein
MKLFIPELGSKLKLKRAWTFPVIWEGRNLSLIKYFNNKLFDSYKEFHENYWKNIRKTWTNACQAVGLEANKGHYYLLNSPISEEKILVTKAEAWLEKNQSEAFDLLNSFEKDNPLIFTLPKGTVLELDRIYIRKGAKEFSSTTFKLRKEKVRFWVKLADANRIEF